MDWDAAEVSEETLRQRVSQVAQACGAQGLDAVLHYASFTRPAQVSALTHFVPFWSQALLAITPSGASMLAMATTGRTVQWIRSASRVDEILVGSEIGAIAGPWLRDKTPARRIAIAAPDDLPHSAHAGLRATLPETIFESADPWLAALEDGFGPTARVAQTTAHIAQSALALTPSASWPDGQTLVAALDGHCRALGAEEVLVKIAPDLARHADPCRLEGPVALGAYFGVRLTLAYKGCWLRAGSSFSNTGATPVEAPACAQALDALRATAARTRAIDALIDAMERASGARVQAWHVEARKGGLPLACVSASDRIQARDAPVFSTFCARLQSNGIPMIVSAPL